MQDEVLGEGVAASGCEISDAQWAKIAPLFVREVPSVAIPIDDRRMLSGMLYVLRSGCRWRSVDPGFGRWNSIYVRFQRWAKDGFWDLLLPELVKLGLTDGWMAPPKLGTAERYGGIGGGHAGVTRKVLLERAFALRRGRKIPRSIQDDVVAYNLARRAAGLASGGRRVRNATAPR